VHLFKLLSFSKHTEMPEIDMQDGHSDFESTSPTDSAPSASYYHTPTLSHSSAGIAKRRKNSKVKMSPILKRAASTPQLNGLSVSESGGLSPSALDKRRNKLGYQRISIACCEYTTNQLRFTETHILTVTSSLQTQKDQMRAC
jgi:hypothetical protein